MFACLRVNYVCAGVRAVLVCAGKLSDAPSVDQREEARVPQIFDVEMHGAVVYVPGAVRLHGAHRLKLDWRSDQRGPLPAVPKGNSTSPSHPSKPEKHSGTGTRRHRDKETQRQRDN
jgi:hypothetical protein